MAEKMEIDNPGIEKEMNDVKPSIIQGIDEVGRANEEKFKRNFTNSPLGTEQEKFVKYNIRLSGKGPALSEEERQDYMRLRELSEKRVTEKLIETKQTFRDSSERKI